VTRKKTRRRKNQKRKRKRKTEEQEEESDGDDDDDDGGNAVECCRCCCLRRDLEAPPAWRDLDIQTSLDDLDPDVHWRDLDVHGVRCMLPARRRQRGCAGVALRRYIVSAVDIVRILNLWLKHVYMLSCHDDSISRINLISVAAKIAQNAPNISVFLIFFQDVLITRRLLIICHHIKFALLYPYLQLNQSWCLSCRIV